MPTLKEWMLDLSAVFSIFGIPLSGGCSYWADSFVPKKYNKAKVAVKPIGSLLVSSTPHYFINDPCIMDSFYNEAMTKRFHFSRGRLVNYGPSSTDPYCLNTVNNRHFKRQPNVVMPSTFVSGGVDMIAVVPLALQPVKVVYNVLVYDVLSELWCLSKNPSGLNPILSFSPVSLDYKKEVVDRMKKKNIILEVSSLFLLSGVVLSSEREDRFLLARSERVLHGFTVMSDLSVLKLPINIESDALSLLRASLVGGGSSHYFIDVF